MHWSQRRWGHWLVMIVKYFQCLVWHFFTLIGINFMIFATYLNVFKWVHTTGLMSTTVVGNWIRLTTINQFPFELCARTTIWCGHFRQKNSNTNYHVLNRSSITVDHYVRYNQLDLFIYVTLMSLLILIRIIYVFGSSSVIIVLIILGLKQKTCRSIKLRELSACGRFVSHTKATERNCRMTAHGPSSTSLLHQPRLWFITGGYLVKR